MPNLMAVRLYPYFPFSSLSHRSFTSYPLDTHGIVIPKKDDVVRRKHREQLLERGLIEDVRHHEHVEVKAEHGGGRERYDVVPAAGGLCSRDPRRYGETPRRT